LIERILKMPSESLPQLDRLITELPTLPTFIKTETRSSQSIDWPHAPIHRVSPSGTYIVTAGTYLKELLFHSIAKLDYLHNSLLSLAKEQGWQLEAWAVFPNHYHFVGHAPDHADTLVKFMKHLHHSTALWLNEHDNTPGRKVWHNYWETSLTFENSYFARLNYVHQNAVHHGLVPVANKYRWCSAAWFERTATVAQVKTIYGFKTDQLKVLDEYDVSPLTT